MKSKIALLIKTMLAVGAVVFLVRMVEPRAVLQTAASADWRWIAAALVLLPLNVLVDGYAWRRLLRHVVPSIRLRDVYGAVLSGHALGFFTPARAGEFAGRAFYLSYGDKWELSAVLFVQRMLDMIGMAAVGAVAFVPFVATHTLPGDRLWWGGVVWGASIVAVLSALVLAPAQVYRLGRRVIPAEQFHERIAFLKATPRREMAAVLALGLFRFGVFSTQMVCLLKAFAPTAGLGVAYWGVILTFYAKALIPPLTLMDLGIREGAAVFFLGMLGLPQAAAFNAALLLMTINLLLPASFGIPFVFRLKLHPRAAREMPARSAKSAQP